MSDASSSSDDKRSAKDAHDQFPEGRSDSHSHNHDCDSHDCDGMMMETLRIQLIRRTTGSRLQVKSAVRAKTPMRRLFENYSELLGALYPGWVIESISRFRSVPHSP